MYSNFSGNIFLNDVHIVRVTLEACISIIRPDMKFAHMLGAACCLVFCLKYLIFCLQLLNPRMDTNGYQDLLSAVKLLISEDKCDGRFIFSHHSPKPTVTKASVSPAVPALSSRTLSGPGGDNSKSQLQTVVTRAGYTAPMYKVKQLSNNQFRATVEFNGMQIMGRPCNNKKTAEKDAASEALEWLMGGTQMGNEYVNHMSMLLKKSKKSHN